MLRYLPTVQPSIHAYEHRNETTNLLVTIIYLSQYSNYFYEFLVC